MPVLITRPPFAVGPPPVPAATRSRAPAPRVVPPFNTNYSDPVAFGVPTVLYRAQQHDTASEAGTRAVAAPGADEEEQEELLRQARRKEVARLQAAAEARARAAALHEAEEARKLSPSQEAHLAALREHRSQEWSWAHDLQTGLHGGGAGGGDAQAVAWAPRSPLLQRSADTVHHTVEPPVDVSAAKRARQRAARQRHGEDWMWVASQSQSISQPQPPSVPGASPIPRTTPPAHRRDHLDAASPEWLFQQQLLHQQKQRHHQLQQRFGAHESLFARSASAATRHHHQTTGVTTAHATTAHATTATVPPPAAGVLVVDNTAVLETRRRRQQQRGRSRSRQRGKKKGRRRRRGAAGSRRWRAIRQQGQVDPEWVWGHSQVLSLQASMSSSDAGAGGNTPGEGAEGAMPQAPAQPQQQHQRHGMTAAGHRFAGIDATVAAAAAATGVGGGGVAGVGGGQLGTRMGADDVTTMRARMGRDGVWVRHSEAQAQTYGAARRLREQLWTTSASADAHRGVGGAATTSVVPPPAASASAPRGRRGEGNGGGRGGGRGGRGRGATAGAGVRLGVDTIQPLPLPTRSRSFVEEHRVTSTERDERITYQVRRAPGHW